MDLKVAPLTVLLLTVNKLRDAILRGHFKPGHRLVESELCRQVGVSRTSIREALRRLEAEKLVTIVPNKGPSVSVISWPEAEQIYQVRGLLEGEAAALFAPRATPADIAQMRAALAEFSKSVAEDDPIGRLESTTRFYQVILAGCGNSVIREILEGLVARINFLRARSMSRPGRSKDSMREMQRMLSAIVKKDATAARAATLEHVRAACEAARDVFQSEIEQQIA
jgi:DNA-binding GntR family transcriptional regulator